MARAPVAVTDRNRPFLRRVLSVTALVFFSSCLAGLALGSGDRVLRSLFAVVLVCGFVLFSVAAASVR